TSDEDLQARAEELNARLLDGRATIGSIRWVSNQKTRWGSCTPSTGAIRITDRLRQVPDYVLDAVILHELVHTFIPGHGPEFWEWADRAPQAERAKGYLEAYQRFG
ncbi:MAG TPA: SprT-like domain-containing protein, partial [Corynebacterium sp.]|nr:SprT-like domain-containing protein [Corynebacterium sp.]